MIQFSLNKQTINYFNKMINLYEAGSLCFNDEKQLFQDLYDSGYIKHLPKYDSMMKRLIKAGLVLAIDNNKVH